MGYRDDQVQERGILGRFAVALTALATALLLSMPSTGWADGVAGMVAIPAGTYERADGAAVQVSSFSLFATETTWSQWQAVRAWARDHGYEIPGGIGRADHPVQNVVWHDAVKWLNALSEMEGKEPCYYLDANRKRVYREGQVELTSANVKWGADGYRLPTEAEWEYAYRAGTTTIYYWGDHGREDRVNTRYAVIHYWNNPEITGGPNAVGGKIANAFGLYDMAGNVEEWCWDRWVADYDGIGTSDPRGPDRGRYRIMRGGGMVMDRMFGAADRHFTYPWYISMDTGFRVASSDPQAQARVLVEAPILAVPPEERIPFSVEKVLVYRPDDDEGLARRLFGHIDLGTPGLEQTRELFEAGRFGESLAAYRDYFVDKLLTGPLRFGSGGGGRRRADRWVALFEKGDPPVFFGPDTDMPDIWEWRTVPSNLTGAWIQTGDRKYFDTWVWYVDHYTRRHKTEWNALTWAEMAAGSWGEELWHYWFARSIGFDAGFGMRIPRNIARMVESPPAGQKAVIPPKTLARVLLSTVEESTGIGLKDDRANVPNQVIANGINLVTQGLMLSEFRDAASWLDIGGRRVAQGAGPVMPDGTNLEYSLNYNAGFASRVSDLADLFPAAEDRPPWLPHLADRRERVIRMYGAIVMPSGAFPSVGNNDYAPERARGRLQSWARAGEVRGLEAIAAAVYGDDGDSVGRPAFTSVVLPYSGYSVLRSGWDDEDLYLFMKASRPGSGHRHGDNNGLHVAAYGRHLLVDCGGPPYEVADLPSHQTVDFPWLREIGGYFGSSHSANTVLVDGLVQKVPAKARPDRGYDTTVGRRWLSTARFDFTEGVFGDGYVSERPVTRAEMDQLVDLHGREPLAEALAGFEKLVAEPVREVDAVHARQILFVKDLDLWIVTDRIDGGREYTQVWNYPPPHEGENAPSFLCPGFRPDQINTDEGAKIIRTTDPHGPNLWLRNFNAAAVSYAMRFGEKYPHRGWFVFDTRGEIVPAVAMHATWTGTAPMVTAIKPLREGDDPGAYEDLSDGAVSGFRLRQGDVTLTYLAAREQGELVAGPLAARGEALLCLADGTGMVGLALGCDAMRMNGRDVELTEPGFEFQIVDGRLRVTEPVIVPVTFDWVESPDGVAPAYR